MCAECRKLAQYAKCHYAECRGALPKGPNKLERFSLEKSLEFLVKKMWLTFRFTMFPSDLSNSKDHLRDR
jgi:hypothetical protein